MAGRGIRRERGEKLEMEECGESLEISLYKGRVHRIDMAVSMSCEIRV